jgi:hypothetical protein
MPQVEKTPVQSNKINNREKQQKVVNENKAEKTIKPPEESQLIKNRDIIQKATKQKFSRLNSLQSLREKMNQQTYKQSANDHYQAFVASKNFIPRSATKFNQLAEAKPVTIKVDCDNTFNKGMMIVSGLLGGGIKCNSFNGSQKYIDKRLEKLGKKPESEK